MLLLRCPKCKNTMKYQQTGKLDNKKVKRCVYCGRSFLVTKQIVEEISC
jgi:hypothetical protein